MTLIVVLAFLIILARSTHRIRSHEVGVLTTFGAYKRVLHPGLNLASPLAAVTLVDLRSRRSALGPWTFIVPSGQVRLVGTVGYRVVDAAKSTFRTNNLEADVVARTHSAVMQSLKGVDLARAGSAGPSLTIAARDALDHEVGGIGIKVESVVLELAPT